MLVAFLFILFANSSVVCQTSSNVGTVAAPFLEIEVGARAVGMGGAFVAIANDASAIYWNPAGLSGLNKIEALLSHNNWLVGTYFDFAGLVYPLGKAGTIALSITSYSTEDMEVRTVQYPDGTGEKFSYGDLATGVSYAKNLTENISVGFNAKYISQRIWHMKSSGFAIDMGTLFTSQFHGMKIGMSISNFGTSMRLEGKDTAVNYDEAPQYGGSNDNIPAFKRTDDFPLPLLFRVGIAVNILENDLHRITIAVDAAHPNDNTEYINSGIEYAFRDYVSLRMGYKNAFARDSEEGLTTGLGAKIQVPGGSILDIHYIYQAFGRLRNAQGITLGLTF